MRLFPRIPLSLASERSTLLAQLSPDKIRRAHVMDEHEAAWYGPTGGSRVDKAGLNGIGTEIRRLVDRLGFPKQGPAGVRHEFDASAARILFEEMDITPSEASRLDMWCFMTCMLLPDVVRWRFLDESAGTSRERFIGSLHGQRRNAFGRLWWRASLLQDDGADDRLHLLSELTEDELVQITERPTVAGYPPLARAIGQGFLQVASSGGRVGRRALIRDGMKRIRRLRPLVLFEGMEEDSIRALVHETFKTSMEEMIGGAQ